jgi:dienelactone hydrolase
VPIKGQLFEEKPAAEETQPHGYSIAKAVKGSAVPAHYAFVLTRDEIYVPIGIRKPNGTGPFAAITMGFGEGKRGMLKVEELIAQLAPMQDRIIAHGYAVITVNYRNEVPRLYNQLQGCAENLPDSISGERRTLKSQPTLDHQDLIAVVRYLQTLPYINKDAIGCMGVSHSGEMILKAAAEYGFAAAVCIEPAAHEFLSVNTGPEAPRKGSEIQYNDVELVRANADKSAAMARIQQIRTPMLIFGRETDHLQGIFKLTAEWMQEAGKAVTWHSFDHPVHGYLFIPAHPDGSYAPDEIQQQAFEIAMSFFDKHLKNVSLP